MLRDKLMHHDPVDGFRWRSHEITRVEGFSDAVFGFAVTLLIVSLEVPRTSGELLATMRGFGAFVVTFLMLAGSGTRSSRSSGATVWKIASPSS
jgi:hypothetical protein